MTEYIVLAYSSQRQNGDEEETHFGPAGWTQIGKTEARSAEAAVRVVVQKALTESEIAAASFVAVPARSWKPVTVTVETKTNLTFS